MKITCRNEFNKEYIRLGSILKLIDEANVQSFGIVSRTDVNQINVICLVEGNRFFNAVTSIEELEKEMIRMKHRWEILKNVELIFD